ncbi:MAG: hypothetical protein ACXVX9_05655 [Mycobacteriaceae bacterium]
MPRGPGDLERRIRDLERLVQELAAARTLENASITASPGLGIRTSDFDGTSFASPGTHGNYFGGDGAVLNALYLRPGSISNTLLTNPVAFDGNGGATTNFAVTTTGASSALGAVTNTVPAGMTKMASFVTGGVTAVNSTASLDYLQCRVGIIDPNSVNYAGNTQYQPVSGSNGSGQVSASKYGLLTGLSGGQHVTHYISVWSASANWAANASSIADVQAIILWGA